MKTTRSATSVDVWRDYGDDGVPRYSISSCDDEGEIRCYGSEADEATAMSRALKIADRLGVSARVVGEDGQVRS